jgi:hypothetical protein
MKQFKLKDMAGNTFFIKASTRKKAIDQGRSNFNRYLYIVDDLKIQHEKVNRR